MRKPVEGEFAWTQRLDRLQYSNRKIVEDFPMALSVSLRGLKALGAAAALAALLASPAQAQSTLKIVAQADLKIIDPIVTTAGRFSRRFSEFPLNCSDRKNRRT